MSQAVSGRRLELALIEQGEHLREHLLDALGGRIEQVEGAVGDARVSLGDGGGIADVGLAHLEEAPAPGQQLERGVHELAGERIEHDVHALARGEGEELLLELERPRRRDVRIVQAHRAQRAPLAGARGRKHLHPEMPRQLHGGHANTPGPGVNQQPLTPSAPRQVHEPPVGGQEHDRHGCRAGERPSCGYRCKPATIADRDRAERAGQHAHHAIAGGEVPHAGTDLQHRPGALAADRRLTRVEIQCDQHIAEVQSSGAYGDAHLSSLKRLAEFGRGHDRQALQRAPLHAVQPPLARRGWKRQRAAGSHPVKARDEHDPLA